MRGKSSRLIDYFSSIKINSRFVIKVFQIGVIIGVIVGITYYINRP